MRILIIRHGEPDYSIDSLTEKGWREAEFLSTRLEKTKIDAIYCSPRGRAKDTAKATLEKKGMTMEILPWLAEWRGVMSEPYGKTNHVWPWDFSPQVWANDERFFDRNNWCEADLINKSNSKEIFEETKKGIDDLLASYGYKRDGMIFRCDDNRDITIAFFCHFALGSALLGYLTGIAPSALWHTFFMPTTSVTTLVSSEMTKGVVSFRCMQLGDTSHLYANGEPVSNAGLMPEIYDGDK
jgi:probable phosphoglycerate mutase